MIYRFYQAIAKDIRGLEILSNVSGAHVTIAGEQTSYSAVSSVSVKFVRQEILNVLKSLVPILSDNGTHFTAG